MKIIIFGATGFIGKRLVNALQSENYELTVITRNARNALEILGETAEFFEWDGENSSDLGPVFKDAYGIINLAGESIASKKWSTQQKERILKSRINTTEAIINEINGLEKKPAVMLQGSAIGYYGSDFENAFDEDSPEGKGFLAEVTQQWESVTEKLDPSVRLVLIRTGIVIGPGGGALKPMTMPFKFGIGGHIGSGKQWLSWIHIDDEIKAITFLLENIDARGVYNLTSPEPVTMKVFAKELGRVLKRSSWFHIPPIIIKSMMGQMGREMLLTSQKVIPGRLIEADFQFQFNDVRLALTNIFNS